MKRIGMFGGAFDPPHRAHLVLAQLAVEALELDELHIIPTGQAWHKARTLSSPEHRLAMTQLAFQDIPHMLVDDRELQRAGPTFTIDTLEALQQESPGAQLYLIMGADQFSAFQQWHKWQAIAGLAIICIADRAPSRDPLHNSGEAVAVGSGWAARRLFAGNSPAIAKKNNAADRQSPADHRPQGVMQRIPGPNRADKDAYFEAYQGLENRFVRLQMPLMATSATQIRQLMTSHAGKNLVANTLVTEPVARYISAHHLYSLP